MMRSRSRGRSLESGFLLVLAVFCVVLLVIQYRWTGEISRAESAQMRASLSKALHQLGDAFDTQLDDSCDDLVPSAKKVDRIGREAAQVARFKAWKAAHRRPCFSRITVAVPDTNGIGLLEMDLGSGRLTESTWPSGWTQLKDRLEALRHTRDWPSTPVTDPASNLIVYPVFDGSWQEEHRPQELEWLIFELNLDYTRRTWMPELVRTYLNPGPESRFDLEVRVAAASNTVLYASHPVEGRERWSPEVKASCFSEGMWERDSTNDADMGNGRWILEGRYTVGQLEGVVARARWRNLAIASLVNGLILAAGILLVRQTRQSRRVTEGQMNFVAGVSHELRTPLTVIRNAAHNLLTGVVKDPDRMKEYVQLIAVQAEQLGQMIEQVLTFSSIRGSTGPVPSERVSLPELLQRAVSVSAAEIAASGCKVEFNLAKDLPPVTGDAAALQRVFHNLLSNAAKYGAAGKWIGISAHKIRPAAETMVEIWIADCGPGIPADEANSVFDPFFRGRRARKEQIRGTGLGLSVARGIVEAHGGTISVRNRNGDGAEFGVRLPAAPGDQTL